MIIRFPIFDGRLAIGSCLCAAWLLGAVTLRAQPDETQWRVFLEPKFMKPEIAFPIPKAERTVLAPGVIEGSEVKLLPRVQFNALGVTWEQFQTRAAANSDAILETLKPEFHRNKKRVIEYAVFSSDQPIISTLPLAPGFRKQFADIFGAKILVAVPNRYTAYVFSALASDYRDYAPMVREAFQATPYPVSLEVFELSAEGIRAIGEYAPP